MEELGVLERKDTNKADAKVTYRNATHGRRVPRSLRHFNCIRKKRENIAGGKFGPSLRPTKLCCYSSCS